MTDTAAAPTTEPTTEGAPAAAPSLLVGESFYGRPPEPEQEEAPEAPEVDPEEAEAEAEAADGDEAEESQEPGEPGETEQPEGDGETISSLDELVEHLELDKDWLQSLKVPVKVDGAPAEATMKDLIASYQMREAAEKRLEEAKAKAKTLTDDLGQKVQELDSQFNVAAKLIGNAEKALDRDTSDIDWATLRQDDPAEYSARKAEISERRQQIEQMKREAVESYQQTVKARQPSDEQRNAYLAQEQNALLEKVPEWKDPEAAKTEKAKLVTYLKSQMGFDEQDIMAAADHRLVLMARKAMLYDEGKAKVQTAKKKIATVPRVMKSGAKTEQKPATPQSREEIMYGSG